MTLTIATWNVNSLRRRLDLLERLVADHNPDIVCLQETKVTDADFPTERVREIGFPFQAVAGMPSYNGVAILSKTPLEDVQCHSRLDDKGARHISAIISTKEKNIEVHSLYVPAGGNLPDPQKNPKFRYKLLFIDELSDWFAGRYGFRDPIVLAGDFNIAPLPSDVWNHKRLRRAVTHTEMEILALDRLKRSLNWIDCLREVTPEDDPVFTWWSYRSGNWKAENKGRRLDHIWVTPALVGSIVKVEVLTDVRNWEPPSDHAPMLLEIKTDLPPLDNAR